MADLNRLFCGDNLAVLQNDIAGESIDLCYIDPPFHSRRNYQSRGSRQGFRDTWSWDVDAQTGLATLRAQASKAGQMLAAMEPVIGQSGLLAYLVSVAQRASAIHRVLRPTGSLFLHCDPTAGHYLKLVLDAIFQDEGGGFRNEIVWCYSHGGRSRKWFGRKHDTIFFYAKSAASYFDPRAVRTAMRSGTHSFGGRLITGEDGRKYRLVYGTRNSHGVVRYYKYYLDEGKLPEDWWTDINSLQASAAERTGYPTQKPEALLARIIAACSRPGDTVLDAYCGSGTTLVAAERAGRRWVGIDSASEAIAITLDRLRTTFGNDAVERVAIEGLPEERIATGPDTATRIDEARPR
ncbi:MAG TPA: site-specific DNA-methyltransferase [Bryobacteraceae bacterium]|jgi:site-specific DNA-methyltransferase (adenine-specific)|nr:site-specific DNA-methyltransferase [Bryobacteraceae bacterium]